MRHRLRRALVTTALAVGTVAAFSAPAEAVTQPVGVDSCTTESFGSDADCTVVVSGGFYHITANGLDDGWTYARIGCNPSGGGGSAEAYGTGGYGGDRIYLPTGVCTLRTWAEWHGKGSITKEA